MPKKIKFLPLKSNQAIAYAAKIAIVIGIIVDGITMAKVFTKYYSKEELRRDLQIRLCCNSQE